jgi:hypothetical protein
MGKIATTVQLSKKEDQELVRLQHSLKLPTKKAVIIEGMRALDALARERERQGQLQRASALVRKQSQKENREWAALGTAAE